MTITWDKKFYNRRKYTSRDGIFFLNASFKSVESTLLNDAFRKKIPSREVYFRPWYIFWWKCYETYHGQKYTSQDGIFFLNASFKSVESTLSNDAFRKKIKGKLSYILSMVYFLMKMTSSKISQWTKIRFLSLDFFLNASFESVESTLSNDAFRKKNPISGSVFLSMVYVIFFLNIP